MSPIEPISRRDLEAILPDLLAPHAGCPAATQQVDSFVQYLDQSACAWEAFRIRRGTETTATLLAMLIPGKTAMLMLPHVGVDSSTQHDQIKLFNHWTARHAPGSFYYLQSLAETDAQSKHILLRRLGFRRLTRLIYLERGVTYPWAEAPRAPGLRWRSVADAGEELLADVLAATYRESRDCPELSDLRPVRAAIEAHRASGVYDPSTWEIAEISGRCAGCLLLSRLVHGPVMEVIYMGIAPAFRGQRLGDLLLRRAVEHCRVRKMKHITLVVDQRNALARRLYDRFGFERIAERDAYLLPRP